MNNHKNKEQKSEYSEHKEEFKNRIKNLEGLNILPDRPRSKLEKIKRQINQERKINSEKEKMPEKKSEHEAELSFQPDKPANKKENKNKTISSGFLNSAPEKEIDPVLKEQGHATEHNQGNDLKEIKFPKGFLWGTSTSAYQVEGGIVHNLIENGILNNVDIYNDWSIWEISKKRKEYLIKNKKNLYDYLCLKACDSYNRYKEDLDLAKKLNNNAIRFGLEWSRIELKKGTWDIKAINHYRDLLREAKKRGFKTVVTLWHYTLPLWVAAEGGWSNKETVNYFLRYTDLIIKEMGTDVDYWVTMNEPLIHILNGYITGKFPPNKKNLFKANTVFNNLFRAHNNAYKLIHQHFPQAKVGLAKMVNFFEPARKWTLIEPALAIILSYYWNHRFLKKTIKFTDYIGLNYYFHDRIVWYPPFKRNKNKKTTDMGWEIYPEGIYHVLKYLRKFNKPIMILENGLADAEDKYRADFIKDHLYYIHKAIQDGVDVRGYFHWSLLDNFEWDKGFIPKFGLYEVNRLTMERTPRPSAEIYADICKNNRVIMKIL